MEDVLLDHAARVQTSNEALIVAIRAIKDATMTKMSDRIAGFGARMLEVARILEEERQSIAVEFDRIAEEIKLTGDKALDANVADVALSSAHMQGELAERTTFWTTGRLPRSDPLPSTNTQPLLTGATPPTENDNSTLIDQAAP